MKFFNIDLHISIIRDFKNIASRMGVYVNDLTLSHHSYLVHRNIDKTKIINQQNWRDINKEMCDRFYREYRHELSQYDGFFVGYPPAFALLFERFGKPIIINAAIRYEVPFHNNPEMWNYLNEQLKRGIDSGQYTIVANSLYDKKYIEHFINRDVHYIPSLCSYGNNIYQGDGSGVFLSSRLNNAQIENIIEEKNANSKVIYGDKLSSIISSEAVVHIPYQVSVMSLFEQYSMCKPVLAPSMDFLLDLHRGNDFLKEISWNWLEGTGDVSVIGPREMDPNSRCNLAKWMAYADFYNKEWFKDIAHFSNWNELRHLLKSENLKEINKSMRCAKGLREEKIFAKWENIIRNI